MNQQTPSGFKLPDKLFDKLKNHHQLVEFGVQPIEAFATVFGPDIAKETDRTIAAIEKEIRDAGYDVKLR